MNILLCAAILFCFGYQVQAYVCPCNWKYLGGRCYYASKQYALSWSSARAYCRARGGDLALPTSPTQSQFILQAMKEKGVKNTWIGLYRVAGGLGNNKFYTVRGVVASYTYWNKGEPNNAGGKEDCVELISGTGRWNDLPCQGYPRQYVCEIGFQRRDN